MSKMKSLTQGVLEFKEKYLQLDNFMPKIKQTIVTITTLATLLNCIIPVAASEPLNVKEYIQQNNYNLSSIFQLYLKPLNDNGLDENEKKAIDIIANAPGEKQEEVKALTKEIYNNKGLTPEILAKLENLNLLSEKQEPVKGLEEKVIQEPENPVNIYAVIANGTDDKSLRGYPITSMLSFYKLLKDVGVSDDNITLFLYHPNHKDFIYTERYGDMMYKPGKQFVSIHFPSDKNQVEIDDEKVTLKKFLKAISNIPSDNNDLVYILYNSHGTKKGEVKFPGGYLTSITLKKAIKKIDYGRLIVMQNSCYSAVLLKKLSGIKDYIAIASSSENRESAAGTVPLYLVESFRKEPNSSISKLVNDGNKELLKSQTPQMVIFYSDKNIIEKPFLPEGYSLN